MSIPHRLPAFCVPSGAALNSESQRMALLVHEALKKFGQTLEVEIGEPMHWELLQKQKGRQQLTTFLYDNVQALSR